MIHGHIVFHFFLIILLVVLLKVALGDDASTGENTGQFAGS